jgi:DNA-binding protein H-NS
METGNFDGLTSKLEQMAAIRAQIEQQKALMAALEAETAAEREAALAQVRSLIEAFGFKASELFYNRKKGNGADEAPGAVVTFTGVDGQLHSWSGRGPYPKALKALAESTGVTAEEMAARLKAPQEQAVPEENMPASF